MIDTPDLFVAVLVTTAVGAWGISMCKGAREFQQHRAAHHHIVMQNEEVARRWRERQLAANTSVQD